MKIVRPERFNYFESRRVESIWTEIFSSIETLRESSFLPLLGIQNNGNLKLILVYKTSFMSSATKGLLLSSCGPKSFKTYF